jgi:hypothetical protein
MSHTFQTPTYVVISAGHDVFWRHFTQKRSTSILKTGSSYVEVPGPSDEQITAADIAYLGGHVYTVDDTEAAALTAAGYGAGLDFVPSSDDATYGGGTYGEGTYGH